MLEKMLDLMQRNFWQIGIIFDLLIATRQFNARHSHDFFIHSRFIFHDEHANRLHAHDRAGDDGAGIGNNNVAWIAIIGQSVRNKTVIAGITHRRIEKPVNDKRTCILIHFIFDRLAANRHLDHNINVIGYIRAEGYRRNIHNRVRFR